MSREGVVLAAEVVGVVGGSIAVLFAPQPALRTTSIVAVAMALLAEGPLARLIGVSLVAFSAGELLVWVEGQLDGLAAMVLVPAFTWTWLVAMTVPAAIAGDRCVRPSVARLRRRMSVPFAGPLASGFLALGASLLTLWATTETSDPVRASVWLAFVTATGVTTAAAIREDRRAARAGGVRRG